MEQFFGLLRHLNNYLPLNKKLVHEIIDFIKMRNNNDKNCFLTDEKDQLMMEQLPKNCQIAIYTQFIFKDFLCQFRLFFNFNCLSNNQFGRKK